MNTTDEFLDRFKSLEYAVRESFGVHKSESAIGYLENEREFWSYRQSLKYCREVRNLLQHYPKINGQHGIEPSEGLIGFLETVIQLVEKPKRAIDIAVPLASVYSAKPEDHIYKIMKDMNENVYTHVPILDNKRVIGVFSENTIFDYLAQDKIMDINQMIVHDFSQFTPLEKHSSEVFIFVSRDRRVFDVKQLFREKFDQGQRIGMVFVTHSGRPEEKLLGILTPWDMFQ